MKTNNFQDIIKAHLDERAASDELFAVNYAKENKNIEECCSYIQSRAREQAYGNFAAIERSEVFGWAIHYYDEDDIKVDEAPATRVDVSKTTPKTEETANKEATKTKKVVAKTVKKEKGVEQLSLFA